MPSIAFPAASIVLLIQSAITKQFLMYDGSAISTHNTQNHQDNFHLVSTHVGAAKYIQLLTNSSAKLGLQNITEEVLTPSDASGDNCTKNPVANSTENQWYVEDLVGTVYTGVKLYVLTGNGDKWYLRAPFLGGTVELVCEDYVTNIQSMEGAFLLELELKFDLVLTNVLDFIH